MSDAQKKTILVVEDERVGALAGQLGGTVGIGRDGGTDVTVELDL